MGAPGGVRPKRCLGPWRRGWKWLSVWRGLELPTGSLERYAATVLRITCFACCPLDADGDLITEAASEARDVRQARAMASRMAPTAVSP